MFANTFSSRRSSSNLTTEEDEGLGAGGYGFAQRFKEKEAERAAAAIAAAEAPYKLMRESQRKAIMRKGRRASILTSPQGVVDPIGSPG